MVTMVVGTEIDDNSLRQSANDIQRRFDRLGQNVGGDFMTQFADGAAANAPKVQKAVDKAADATGRLRSEQEKLDALTANGASRDRIVTQSEKVAKARRDEARAYREATAAVEDYDRAGQRAGNSFTSGLRSGEAGASEAGGGFADSFAGGFAGASSLSGLGGGLLKAGGWITAGITAGKLFSDAVGDGMATIQLKDQFQARMGLDDSAMAEFGDAAGRAYANNFGLSLEDTLSTSQAALRTKLVDPDATAAEVQAVIEQLEGMEAVTEATATELSRSMATLMRTGLADSMSEASDIITAGFQSGLDVSGDWLDTINEYSTQFRKFGLDAGEFMMLLSQGLEGGARDTDKVADSLKEFSIRAVDGSQSTAEAFAALGFSADEMGRMFAQGGDSAKVALDATFDAIKRIDDPMQQSLIWQQLFGTQFEDMGDAINRFDLDPVKNQFADIEGVAARSTQTATDNFSSKWGTATRTVGQYFSDLKTDVAAWFSGLPIVSDVLPEMLTTLFGDQPRLQAPGAIQGAVPGTPLNPLDIAAGGTGGWWGTSNVPQAETGVPGVVLPPDAASTPLGELLLPSQQGPTPPTGPVAPRPTAPTQGTPVPIVPDGADAGSGDKPVIDPSRYSLDSVPISIRPDQLPGVASSPSMSQQVWDMETQLLSQRQSVEEARLRVLELEAGGTATQSEINAARTAQQIAERQYVSQLQKLAEAQQGTWQKLEDSAASFASGMEDIGAALDSDFGLSEGLPGLAENLTKFIANLAAAPLLGQLSAIKQAAGDEGSGLMGILASNGAFGPRFMPNNSGIGAPGYSPSTMGPAELQQAMTYGVTGGGAPYGLPAGSGSGAQFPAWVLQLERIFGVSASTYAGHQERDGLNKGIDWSGPVENMQRFADYLATIPGSLEQVIWQNPNTGGKTGIADGQFVGPGTSQPGYYANDWGGHQDHVHTRQSYSLPVPATPAVPPVPSYPQYQPSTGAAPAPAPVLPSAPVNAGTLPPLPAPGTVPSGGSAMPGTGFPQAPAFMAPPGTPGNPIGQSVIPGQSPGVVPGAGAGMTGAIGGIPLAAGQAAASSLDLLAPGAGAAANVGIQLLNTAIGYGGRQIGNLWSGLFETLSLSGSDGGMTDPLKTLPGRVLAGIAGARPSLPNTAGGGVQPQPQGDPRQNSTQQMAERGGALVNIEQVNQAPGQEPASVANEVASQVRAAEYASSAFRI
ncbi:phage tail tape measure protein [Mycolicibacterium sp. jd]|uniref:phage tail tape measure protein n=1 Tax=unclassified Mycolicibacterium TaxID=2636767 RepID=UPI00351BB0BB